MTEKPNEGYVRSKTNVGALINVDSDSYSAYKKQRYHASQVNNELNKINSLENEMNGLKEDILEIKNLLLKVLNK
jgi:hypothetical protein